MSADGTNFGIAFIEVVDSANVNVTKRVKAVGKAAVWFVLNKSTAPVKVGVANFRPHVAPSPATASSSSGGGGAVGKFPAPVITANPTNPIQPGGRGAIPILFDFANGIYDYDVTLDGKVAVDPELEI